VLTELVCKPVTSYEEDSQQFLSLKISVVTIFTVKRNIKKLHSVYLLSYLCDVYAFHNKQDVPLPMQHQPTGLSILETHFLREKGNEPSGQYSYINCSLHIVYHISCKSGQYICNNLLNQVA